MAMTGTSVSKELDYRDIERIVAAGNVPPSLINNPTNYKLLERLYATRSDLRPVLNQAAPQIAIDVKAEEDRRRKLQQQQADMEDRADARAEGRASVASSVTSAMSSKTKYYTSSTASSSTSSWELASWFNRAMQSFTDNPVVHSVTNFFTKSVPTFFTQTVPNFFTKTIPNAARQAYQTYVAPVVKAVTPYVAPVIAFVTNPAKAAFDFGYNLIAGHKTSPQRAGQAAGVALAAAMQPKAQAPAPALPARRRDGALRTMQSQQQAHQQTAPAAQPVAAHTAPVSQRPNRGSLKVAAQIAPHTPKPQQVAAANPHRSAPRSHHGMAPV